MGGSLEGMKYNIFNEWMNGKVRAKKPIKGHIIRNVDAFIRHNSGMGIALGTILLVSGLVTLGVNWLDCA